MPFNTVTATQRMLLLEQLAALRELNASTGTILKTQADMMLATHLTRLIEVLLDGVSTTGLPTKHHP